MQRYVIQGDVVDNSCWSLSGEGQNMVLGVGMQAGIPRNQL